MGEIKIIVADQHPLFMEGICSLLREEMDLEVRGTCSVKDAIRLNHEFPADIVLFDWDFLSNGSALPKFVIHKEVPANLLIMSNSPFSVYVVEILRAGAKGFILKTISKAHLLLAIRAIANGDLYICKEAAKFIVNNLLIDQSTKVQNELESINTLSNREKDILKYISNGYTNYEIAEKLFISTHTVATHRRNILQKINVKNTAGLVRYASKLGLFN